jgi:hypothetical protein
MDGGGVVNPGQKLGELQKGGKKATSSSSSSFSHQFAQGLGVICFLPPSPPPFPFPLYPSYFFLLLM